MSRPFYTDFAWAYDLLIQEPVADRLAFITRMLAQHGAVPGAHVLDAGCNMAGLDLSEVDMSGLDFLCFLHGECNSVQA